jgi:hypothetical protein
MIPPPNATMTPTFSELTANTAGRLRRGLGGAAVVEQAPEGEERCAVTGSR